MGPYYNTPPVWYNILIVALLGVSTQSFCEETFPTPICSYIPLSAYQEIARYPGPQMEKKLKDYLKADYHCGLACYYTNTEKAGFMPLERFLLSYEKAIGDIREAAHIAEDDKRCTETQRIVQNWQAAFSRAQIKDPLP